MIIDDEWPEGIDPWPNEEEMSEVCGCTHTLGQHAYGDDMAPCDICACPDFHSPGACPYRKCDHGASTSPGEN